MKRKKTYTYEELLLREIALVTRNDIIKVTKDYDTKSQKEADTGAIIDDDFIKYAKAYDKGAKENEQRIKRKKVFRMVATFVLCAGTISFATIGFADAFDIPFFNITHNQKDNAIIFTHSESELLGKISSYYYPEFTPKGFILIDAGEYFGEKTFIFQSVDEEITYRITENDKGTEMGVDSETNQIEEVRVGVYHGYYAIDNKYKTESLFWLTDENLFFISVDGLLGKDMLLKIAESLKYVK